MPNDMEKYESDDELKSKFQEQITKKLEEHLTQKGHESEVLKKIIDDVLPFIMEDCTEVFMEIHQENFYSGLTPSPEMLNEYEQIYPGYTKELFEIIKKDQDFNIERFKRNDENIKAFLPMEEKQTSKIQIGNISLSITVTIGAVLLLLFAPSMLAKIAALIMLLLPIGHMFIYVFSVIFRFKVRRAVQEFIEENEEE